MSLDPQTISLVEDCAFEVIKCSRRNGHFKQMALNHAIDGLKPYYMEVLEKNSASLADKLYDSTAQYLRANNIFPRDPEDDYFIEIGEITFLYARQLEKHKREYNGDPIENFAKSVERQVSEAMPLNFADGDAYTMLRNYLIQEYRKLYTEAKDASDLEARLQTITTQAIAEWMRGYDESIDSAEADHKVRAMQLFERYELADNPSEPKLTNARNLLIEKLMPGAPKQPYEDKDTGLPVREFDNFLQEAIKKVLKKAGSLRNAANTELNNYARRIADDIPLDLTGDIRKDLQIIYEAINSIVDDKNASPALVTFLTDDVIGGHGHINNICSAVISAHKRWNENSRDDDCRGF